MNINDCCINKKANIEKIKNHTNSIDIYLSQFSYGQYEGSENEPEKKIKAIDTKNDHNKKCITGLQPRYTIPFASYIYFAMKKMSK